MASNLALALEPRQCQVCHTRAGLQRCGGCKSVYYCGREHQASHRDSHKHGCTHVRKALVELNREEHKLRSGQQGGFFFFSGANLFEEQAGHFWDIPETHDYMKARYAVMDEMLGHFKNADAVQAALDHLTDMLRLGRRDDLGFRNIVPALYLRLGRDQECYDFLKWWATTGERRDYDWADMTEPYLDVKGADVFESPRGPRKLQLGHAASVMLIKVRILLDLEHMLNATRAFQGAAQQEIIDIIRGEALVSSVVAARRDIVQASQERTEELWRLVYGQVKILFGLIADYSPTFWRELVNPDSGREGRPNAYLPRSEEEVYLDTMAAVSTEPAGGTPSSRAAEYLAQDQFHRRFTLPGTADHGELQVSYADVGRAPDQGDGGTHHPTILFIPGMFASRYLGVWMHAIAEKLGVRVLVVDR
ncbi:hypothetical protein Daus18300_000356 [Diaporthe australafricana]|uniref:MYND-type domain-containing protein n=1 Tax=Diaporthe australafricana TaxID=127596 RepID=A0ABR3Y4S2_9PEZI